MPLYNILHLHPLFLLSISIISISTLSSRPISTTPSTNTVVLTASGGEKFEVELQVAMQSETIRRMIMDRGFSHDEMVLSFPNISGEIMSKVVEYCEKHVYYDGAGNNITAVEEMRAFDMQFVDVRYQMLFKLVLAANDLKIKKLLDIVSGRIGDMMMGKNLEEIRIMFNISENSCVDNHPPQNEFNTWAFQ